MTALVLMVLLALDAPAPESPMCASSKDCKYFGLCVDGADCVASSEGCRGSVRCEMEGLCELGLVPDGAEGMARCVMRRH